MKQDSFKKAVVFDCFGVLVQTKRSALMERCPESVRDRLREINLQSDYGFLSRKEYELQFSEITQLPITDISIELTHGNSQNKTLLRYTEMLKSRAKIGLLSNVGRDWIQEFLPEEVQKKIFDEIILSSEVGMVKPWPEIYEYMCQRIDSAPENVLFIDDSEENVQGARSIGMQAIRYIDFNQTRAAIELFLQN